MARNVGSIEVTVDANTGKLTAKMRKAGRTGGNAYAEEFEDELGKVSGRQLQARLKLIQKRAEAALQDIDIDVGIDDAAARAGIKKLEAQLRAAQLELTVNSELDNAKLLADLDALRLILRDIRMDVETKVNPGDVLAIKRLVEGIMGDVEVQIKPEIDRGRWQLAKAQVNAMMTKIGEEGGDNLGKGMMSGDNTKMIIAAVVSMGDALAAGLSGGLAAATAVVSSAVQALAGAAGAAVPIVAGLGAALTAGIVGAQGFGDEMKAVSKEFDAAKIEGRAFNMSLVESSESFRMLTPAAQDAVRAFADVRGGLRQLREETQEELFTDVDEAIRSMGKETIPDMSNALEIAAGSVNEFGLELVKIANNTNFAETMERLDPALDDAFDAASALVGALEPFLKSAAKPAERLAEMIERVAEGLRDWTIENQGEIESFLDDGVTSLRQWGSLVASVGDLLGTIFAAGAESGDSFVASLDRMIERWDHILETDPSILQDFFQTGTDAIAAMQPVMDGLKEAFDLLITPDTMGHFEDLAAAIGDMLPIAARLITLFGELEVINAFSMILSAVEPLISLLEAIPGPVLEVIGVMMALSKVFGVVSMAMKAMMATNPWLLAIAATLSIVMVAIDAFSSKSSDATERTNELTGALQDNVDAMIASGDAADSASLGMDALNKAIFETGDGGEKLEKSFQTINSGMGDMQLGAEDAAKTLMGIRDSADEGASALADLAEGYGLPADAAKTLGDIVASTDDNMKTAESTSSTLGRQMTELADQTGLPREELVKLFGALEEVQDQAENTDFDKLAADFLAAASTGDDLEQSILRDVEAMRKAGTIADTNVAAYHKYVEILDETKNATDEASDSSAHYASSQEMIQDSIDDAIAAHKAKAEALKAERKEAMDAWKEEKKLAEVIKDTASAMAQSMGMSAKTADGLIAIGDAARVASGAADALASALDTLLAPTMNVQEATSNWEAAIDDLDASIKEHGATLDLGTEAGRANAEQIRTNVDALTDMAEAQLAAGASAEEMGNIAMWNRGILVGQAEALFTTSEAAGTAREQAENYINTMGLTPELIETVFSQPGLVDALLNAEDLTLLYDETGEPVITEFQSAGIDESFAETEGFKELLIGLGLLEVQPTVNAPTIPDTSAAAEALAGDVETLDGATADPTITASTLPKVQTDMDKLLADFEKLNRTKATPTVLLPSYSTINTNLSTLQRAVDKLSVTSASISITTPGIQTAINKVNELDRAIDNLTTSKTVTITERTVKTGGMTGAMITSPRDMHVGERGYAEALVPLELPLNRVDPSVRHFAELLRGGSSRGEVHPGTGKIVNNYMTITPISADPGAVATQVINRSAMMANR